MHQSASAEAHITQLQHEAKLHRAASKQPSATEPVRLDPDNWGKSPDKTASYRPAAATTSNTTAQSHQTITLTPSTTAAAATEPVGHQTVTLSPSPDQHAAEHPAADKSTLGSVLSWFSPSKDPSKPNVSAGDLVGNIRSKKLDVSFQG